MCRTIVHISPGPNFNARSPSYQKRYLMLSRMFRGYILTTSPTPEEFSIGNFTYLSMASDYSLRSAFRFGVFCFRNAGRLAKANERVDLVTTYDPLKTGLIGLIVSRILKCKFAPEVNGVYTSPAEHMDEADRAMTKIKRFIYPKLENMVLKNASGVKILFPEQLQPFRRITEDKIVHCFPSLVDIDLFLNHKRGEERKEILFVGFPYKRKGVDILIEAFKRISDRYPNWRLKIIGWFPKPEELLSHINNHPQIDYHPPVKHSDMVQHICTCAIFVLPSRSEAMGRVLVEAMAAGKPRIGSNVDGIPTVINDGLDGLLFESGNVVDLTKKLETLIDNAELRYKLGSAGRDRARKEFTSAIYGEKLSRFYMEVIEHGL